MIRRSTAIAAVAVLLSLLGHVLGLSVVSRIPPEQTSDEAPTEVVALDNAFEDIAESVSEPVPPEPVEAPEPPVETPPEPDLADTPTSEVLVASSNPQQTVAPDTGTTVNAPLDTAGPSEINQTGVPEPESVEPSGGEESTVAETEVTPPVEQGQIAEAPLGTPDAPAATPDEAAASEPNAPVAPEVPPDQPQSLAALTPPTNPVLPIAPAPDPATIPTRPAIPEGVEPEVADEPAAEEPEPVEGAEEPDTAVVSSIRPQLAPPRPGAQTQGRTGGRPDIDEIRRDPSKRIESPLDTYRRTKVDVIGRRMGGQQSGGPGFSESRGPGNSDVTNYEGLVFVHLNRTPAPRVSARGWAKVFFTINPDGTLGAVNIIDGSGSREVDSAAKRQIRAAVPFPKPPDGQSKSLSLYYSPNW